MKLKDILESIARNIKELLNDASPIKPIDFGIRFFSIAIDNLAESMVDPDGKGVSNITEVTISDEITSISMGAFSGITTLKTLNLNKVESIGYNAFSQCGIEYLYIPPSLTNIAYNSFTRVGATSIIVDEQNPKYSSPNNCNAIVETASKVLIFGNSSTSIPISEEVVTSIGNGAFYMGNLKTLNLPSNIKRIDINAFSDCYNLYEVVLNEGLQIIGNSAFARCSSITELVFPSTLINIGTSAFSGCSKIQTYDFSALENPPTLSNVNAFDGKHPEGWKIKVPQGKKDIWISAPNWSDLSLYIEEEQPET